MAYCRGNLHRSCTYPQWNFLSQQKEFSLARNCVFRLNSNCVRILIICLMIFKCSQLSCTRHSWHETNSSNGVQKTYLTLLLLATKTNNIYASLFFQKSSASDKRDKNFYLTILSIAKFLLEQHRLQTYKTSVEQWWNEHNGEEWRTRWGMENSVKNEVTGEEWNTQWRMKYSVKNDVLAEEWSNRWRMK